MRRPIRTQCTLVAAVVAVGFFFSPVAPASATVRGAAPYLLGHTLDGKLNVNTATAEQWDLLPGIGPAMAAKLVAYRSRRPFAHVSHVMRIKGIGRKTYGAIRPYLTLEGETTLRAVEPQPARATLPSLP